MASDKCDIDARLDPGTRLTVVSCKTCQFGGGLSPERATVEGIEKAKASLREHCRHTTRMY